MYIYQLKEALMIFVSINVAFLLQIIQIDLHAFGVRSKLTLYIDLNFSWTAVRPFLEHEIPL
jgi:hypothetical protein